MAEPGIVIVGASHAGVGLAAALRQKKYAGPVTLIGEDAELPYHRPPLSKELLAGKSTPTAIRLRAENFYADQGVDLVRGTQVTGIDRVGQTIELSGGRTIPYSKLVLATGARARSLPVPGADLAGVYSLRSLADAQALGSAIVPGVRVVIAGAGYIGLEVAASVQTLGADVRVIERADAPLSRVASPPVATWACARHESRGVHFRFESTVREIVGHDHQVEYVRLADGSELPADVTLIGVGAVPNVDLAAHAGLKTDDGILVDSALCTGDENVFAIGDCARFPCWWTGNNRRLESVQNAQDQARTLATTLTNSAPEVYRALPWFWSDQGPDKLQSAGSPHPEANYQVEGDPEHHRFTVRHLLDGRLIATESVNDPKAHIKTRREIEPVTTIS